MAWPSAPGTIRLTTGHAPEDERPLLLREFFEHLGVRYDAERVGSDPMKSIHAAGFPAFTAVRQAAGRALHPLSKSNDPTEDVGLIVNGRALLAQRGREMRLGDGESLIALTETLRLHTVRRAPARAASAAATRSRLAGRRRFMCRSARQCCAGLLIDYVNIAGQVRMRTAICGSWPSHLYDPQRSPSARPGCGRDGAPGPRRAACFQATSRGSDNPTCQCAPLAPWVYATLHPAAVRVRVMSFTDYVLAERWAALTAC